jgi:hypothetical protein
LVLNQEKDPSFSRSLQGPKFPEFFSRQISANSIKKAKTGTPADKLGGWPFKNSLKKTLSECRFLTIAYPKPNQTHGETNDQKRA